MPIVVDVLYADQDHDVVLEALEAGDGGPGERRGAEGWGALMLFSRTEMEPGGFAPGVGLRRRARAGSPSLGLFDSG